MLNYFNFEKRDSRYLLTNDFGSYAYLDEADFSDLVQLGEVRNADLQADLTDKGFVYSGSSLKFSDDCLLRLRASKAYAFSATSLHIFVVTTACNYDCVYCQAKSDGDRSSLNMSEEIARKAVDIALASPSQSCSFEFQGGEPLLNYDVIKFIVEYSSGLDHGKQLSYSVVSNLSCLTEEMLAFFKRYRVTLSTSLDGPQQVHDANRPLRSGGGTYEATVDAIRRVKEYGIPLGAIQTTARASLPYAREIVDEYCALGLNSVFVRPITPLGMARVHWDSIGYTPQEFAAFYRSVLDRVIELNAQGKRMRESHAAMILAKALNGSGSNYMELRSPCGAALGQLAYYPNGDVFTCDEGRMLFEMGDASFKLGSVHSSSFESLVTGPMCRAVCAASVLESVPECCDCVYQPYCGICPVVNKSRFGDLLPKAPNDMRCLMFRGVLDAVFEHLQRNDLDIMNLFKSWS